MNKFFTTCSIVVMALTGTTAAAEEYPSKTIEVVTHAGNGGGTDVTTRMMMLRARRELKADMVIVNKKGGGGAVAMDHYLTVPADGYSILTFTIGHAATVAKGKTKMVLDDIRPIARGTDDPQILMVKCGAYADANAFVAALTASFTSSTSPKDITAHSSSVEGSITFKSLDFFGETHSLLI